MGNQYLVHLLHRCVFWTLLRYYLFLIRQINFVVQIISHSNYLPACGINEFWVFFLDIIVIFYHLYNNNILINLGTFSSVTVVFFYLLWHHTAVVPKYYNGGHVLQWNHQQLLGFLAEPPLAESLLRKYIIQLFWYPSITNQLLHCASFYRYINWSLVSAINRCGGGVTSQNIIVVIFVWFSDNHVEDAISLIWNIIIIGTM